MSQIQGDQIFLACLGQNWPDLSLYISVAWSKPPKTITYNELWLSSPFKKNNLNFPNITIMEVYCFKPYARTALLKMSKFACI